MKLLVFYSVTTTLFVGITFAYIATQQVLGASFFGFVGGLFLGAALSCYEDEKRKGKR